MSSAVCKQKTENKFKKRRKKKRSASSPLNESSRPDKLTSVNFNGANYNGTNHGNNGSSGFDINYQCWQHASDGFHFVNSLPNMSFSQASGQFGGFAFPNQSSYSTPVQSPPGQPMQGVSTMVGGTPMMGSQPPDWAASLINDVKAIKSQVSKIDNIEKTMNKMCTQIHDLEVNVGDITTRLNTVEKSCTFVGKQYDDHKKELDVTKRS